MQHIKDYEVFEELWFDKLNNLLGIKGVCLPIVKIPDPILRKVCHDINIPNGEVPDDIKKLSLDMFETMWGIGVGLAAPQIGKDINMFIIKSGKETFINPKITWKSPETKDSTEGCLSIPYQRGTVTRHKRIRVEYININGKKINKEFSGFEAIVIQHEYDHLHGILFTDRM